MSTLTHSSGSDGPWMRGRLGGARSLVVTLAVLGAVRLIFPGDVPFINDEPLIISSALEANEARTLVPRGLTGTRGAPYGPLPTWLYQAALSATSDLRVVVVARVVFVTALTGWAIVLLAGSVGGVVPLLGAFALLSPYLWLYARDLWDNSFGVPFSAMCLAAYARFVVTRRVGWLSAAVGFGTACLLTHLMTLPLIAAVALHFASTRGREVIRSPRLAVGLGVSIGVALLVSAPYLRELARSDHATFALSPHAPSLVFALAGFRIFSFVGFDYVIGPWRAGGLAPLLVTTSALVFPVGVYGFLVLLRRAQELDSSPEREIARVLLYTLLFFVLLANGERLVEHPHYYGGVWAAFFCFWWVGMSRLLARAWARRSFYGQAAVAAGFLIGLVSWLHANHGTRSLRYGPTLGNQMEVASELERRGAEAVPPSLARHPGSFPHAIRVLRILHRRSGGATEDGVAPSGSLRIDYADPDSGDGAIVVRETLP